MHSLYRCPGAESELGAEAEMETLYDTLPPVPEGKQLSQLWVGLLMYSDMKYNLNLTGSKPR